MFNTMDTTGMGSELFSLVQAGLLSPSVNGCPDLAGGTSPEAAIGGKTGDASELGQEAQNMSPSLEDGMLQMVQTQIKERAQLDTMRNQLLQSIMQKLQQNIKTQGDNAARNAAKTAAAQQAAYTGTEQKAADTGGAPKDAAGKDATADKTAGDATPGGGGEHCAQATEIAKEMASYKYQFYYDDKKSNTATESSKSGNCCDLAQVAIEKFKEKGIDARLVLGDVQGKGYTGGYYWIEYKDPTTGKMTFFDPTAAASNKSAERAFQGLHSTYSKRK